MLFEQTKRSSILQGTHIKETGRKLQASDLSLFVNRGQVLANDHSLGISAMSIIRWTNTGSYSGAISFRTLE